MPHFGVWKQGNHVTPGDSVEWSKQETNANNDKIIRVRRGVIIAISTTTNQVGYIKSGIYVAIIYIKSKNTYGDDTITYPLDEYGQLANYKSSSKYGELRVTEKFFINEFYIGNYTENDSRSRWVGYSSETHKIFTKNLVRQFTMKARKVDYIQKEIKIGIENVGTRKVVHVNFTSRVCHHSLERSAPLPEIPPTKKTRTAKTTTTTTTRNSSSTLHYTKRMVLA